MKISAGSGSRRKACFSEKAESRFRRRFPHSAFLEKRRTAFPGFRGGAPDRGAGGSAPCQGTGTASLSGCRGGTLTRTSAAVSAVLPFRERRQNCQNVPAAAGASRGVEMKSLWRGPGQSLRRFRRCASKPGVQGIPLPLIFCPFRTEVILELLLQKVTKSTYSAHISPV